MKKITLLFAAILTIGALGRGQNAELSAEADIQQPAGVAPPSPDAAAPPGPESMPPAVAAFIYYFRIQTALSQDSLTNVAANVRALAAAVRQDSSGGFPVQLADQADGLARDAVTLPGARLDFAVVSSQFMQYLTVRNPPPGLAPVHRFYDPKTKLYWFQTGDVPQNPYLGTGRAVFRTFQNSSVTDSTSANHYRLLRSMLGSWKAVGLQVA